MTENSSARRWKHSVGVLGLSVGMAMPLQAQHSGTNAPPSMNTVPPIPSVVDVPIETASRLQVEQRIDALRERARQQQRLRKAQQDAATLVVLTARYREQVNEHGSQTSDDLPLLQQIEKLARSVKKELAP